MEDSTSHKAYVGSMQIEQSVSEVLPDICGQHANRVKVAKLLTRPIVDPGTVPSAAGTPC